MDHDNHKKKMKRMKSVSDHLHMQTEMKPPEVPSQPNFVPTFDFNHSIASVKAKHGAIDKDCILHSECMKMLNLYGILKILNELNNKSLDKLDYMSIKSYYDMVDDAKKLKIDLTWLLKRLDEIEDAIISRGKVRVLQGQKDEQVQKREEKLKRLEGVRDEKSESMVLLDDLIIEDLDIRIGNLMPKLQRFECRPLLDGLI